MLELKTGEAKSALDVALESCTGLRYLEVVRWTAMWTRLIAVQNLSPDRPLWRTDWIAPVALKGLSAPRSLELVLHVPTCVCISTTSLTAQLRHCRRQVARLRASAHKAPH